MTPRGGKRKGSGRKEKEGLGRAKTVSFSLYQKHIDIFTRYMHRTGRNKSDALRDILEALEN